MNGVSEENKSSTKENATKMGTFFYPYCMIAFFVYSLQNGQPSVGFIAMSCSWFPQYTVCTRISYALPLQRVLISNCSYHTVISMLCSWPITSSTPYISLGSNTRSYAFPSCNYSCMVNEAYRHCLRWPYWVFMPFCEQASMFDFFYSMAEGTDL